MEIDFSNIKVHNEIEYCIIKKDSIKKAIERAFLSNRISYCEIWNEPSIWQRILMGSSGDFCTLCINSQQVDTADQVMVSLDLSKDDVQIVKRNVSKTYFAEV
ncbi:MAG TPA: hypothetical protein DCG85_00915 [Lachnospiraceae bacterium]|nr:hypothetical protein [Lachnospiraceae bacterium]